MVAVPGRSPVGYYVGWGGGWQMLRRRRNARMVGAVVAAVMMDFDLHCAKCGRTSGADALHCAGCGARLPRADGGGRYRGGTGGADWGTRQVAVGLLLFLGLLLLAALVSGGGGAFYPAQERALATWVGVHVLAWGVAPIVWFLGARRSADPRRALGLMRPRTSGALTAALTAGALGVSLLAAAVYGAVVDVLGLEALRPPEVDDDAFFSGAAILLTFQAVAGVTPVSEEIMFRSFALRGLLRDIGPGPAVVGSAVLFSVLHLEPGIMIPIFFTGLALGWLHVKTGSVWPCVAAHAGQNGLALLAARGL